MEHYIVKYAQSGSWLYITGYDLNDTSTSLEIACHFSRAVAEKKVRALKRAGFQQVRLARAGTGQI